ncbi:MAG: transglycosylase SLT domain-containing protein, partial [Bryobacteraceae bacterium]
MIVLFLVLTAAEYAVLSNGFRLAAERHEIQGSVVRLYNKDGGYTEIDAALVESIEREQNAPGPAPPPRPAAPPPARGTDELIDAAARRNGLPPQFVHSVVAAESAYRPGAVSPKGAVGL